MARELTNDQFRELWFLLDRHIKIVTQDEMMGLSSRTPLGIVELAERVQQDLEAFKDQIVARSKARFESVAADRDMLRDHVGAERFDSTPTEYAYGLDFGTRPKA